MRSIVLAGALVAGGFAVWLCWLAGGAETRPAAAQAASCSVDCGAPPHPEQSRAARFARVFQD
jgi:hypothetical protein